MHCVMSVGKRVRACTGLSEGAKALATRDHVRDISGLSALSNREMYKNCAPIVVSGVTNSTAVFDTLPDIVAKLFYTAQGLENYVSNTMSNSR
jgi:hypothetical protein